MDSVNVKNGGVDRGEEGHPPSIAVRLVGTAMGDSHDPDPREEGKRGPV